MPEKEASRRGSWFLESPSAFRPPGRRIGDARIKHFARPNQVVQSAHDLFDRRDLIPDVNPLEIDIVGSQPFETRFHLDPA
jgi:hypothetical protein